MKKLMVMVIAVLLFANTISASRGPIILNLYGNNLHVAANSFTGQSSHNKVFFEAKAAVLVSRNLYVWASHGYFPLRDSSKGWSSKSKFTQDLDIERTLGKRIISLGCGYFLGYLEAKQIAMRGEIGVCRITNAIDVVSSYMDTNAVFHSREDRQSAIGLRGNLSFTYGIYKNVFAELSGGYMYASDKIDSVRSNLGGFHLALGLGINF
jgi:hypothetical protein